MKQESCHPMGAGIRSRHARELRHRVRQRHEAFGRFLSGCDRPAAEVRLSEWSEFATEGATFALHRSEAASASQHETELPAGRCRPGLSVGNLDAFHSRMIEHNVICTQQPKDLFGARIAQYLDPDGLAISVSEDRR
jgi:hypothetical protein